MKSRAWILMVLSVVFVVGLMSACQKKKDTSVTQSGGGLSSQSVVTLQGAAR